MGQPQTPPGLLSILWEHSHPSGGALGSRIPLKRSTCSRSWRGENMASSETHSQHVPLASSKVWRLEVL